MENEIRMCAYCGLEKCEHSYRFARKYLGRKGGISMRMENITTQTTIAEMKEEFNKIIGPMADNTPAVWTFAFTKQGKPKQ